MENIDVAFGPCRTQHYHKVVKYWKENYQTATASEGENLSPGFVSSIFEIYDFIAIYNAFQNVPITQLNGIVAKLQKGVNGPISSAEETDKSRTARNFLFEALFAAKVHSPGNKVEAILGAESDTGIKINGKKLWVECKRVTSEKKIEANVKKACKQLETIIKKQTGSGHRGIVALEVTKIMSPDDSIFVSNNDSELVASVDRMMDKFVQEHYHIWERIYERRSHKIIGIIIRFAFMSSSEGSNLLVHTSQWGLNPRRTNSESDSSVLQLLESRLSNNS